MADVAALVLAAGASRRMGRDKLSLDLGRGPLVRLVAEAALASQAASLLVVTGPDGSRVRAALAGLPVRFVVNEHAAEGLSTSLAAGLAALDPAIGGAVVCLGDMPEIRTHTIDALIQAYRERPDATAFVPVHEGRRGNPVLLARALFAAARALQGDTGARKLLAAEPGVVEVPVADAGIHLDLDDPEAVTAYLARR